MTRRDISGKLKSLTEGKKSEKIIDNMTRTFIELNKLADFSDDETSAPSAEPEAEADVSPPDEGAQVVDRVAARQPPSTALPVAQGRLIDGLTYRIELVLPPVRDKAVYDAIFRSLREHLL
jgi:hypothetical protein